MNDLTKVYPLTLFLVLSLWSCKNKDDCCVLFPDLIGQEWLSVSIQEGQNIDNAPHDLLLTFSSDSAYSLQLDVNDCGGDLVLDQRIGNIQFISTLCTEACCDSDYAMHLKSFLSEVDRYELTIQELTLFKGNHQARFKIK